ncbi:MAG: hypothetical protein JWM43_1968 [Acidobacteriaceae bacterium]|nr:hypothetical protein [Acidobacteriaceae bacterium]
MNLIRRSLISVSMVAVSVLSAPAIHAATFNPIHAMFAKGKTIQISLRNDTASDIQLRAGDDAMTLVAGKTLSVKLVPGTRIVTSSDTATHKAGDLVVEVSASLNGATIAIH